MVKQNSFSLHVPTNAYFLTITIHRRLRCITVPKYHLRWVSSEDRVG
ncbi:unnamed protein product [Brassica oleracea]